MNRNRVAAVWVPMLIAASRCPAAATGPTLQAAADRKYAVALKTERDAAMKDGDLPRAKKMDEQLYAFDTDAASPFDLRSSLVKVRYFSTEKSIDITNAMSPFVSQHKL